MVTGSTERGITSQGCVGRADPPCRALKGSALGGIKPLRARVECLAGQKASVESLSIQGVLTLPTRPVSHALYPPGNKRFFPLEKLNKNNIGLGNTKYGGR